MNKTPASESFMDKYGFANDDIDVSDYLKSIEDHFRSEFDFKKHHLEMHRMKFPHGATVVLYRPAQDDEEFDAEIAVTDNGKDKEFSWAFDDNWDERWTKKRETITRM